MKKSFLLILTSLLVTLATLSVTNGGSQPAQEKPKNIIIITLKRMELGDIEAQVNVIVKNLLVMQKVDSSLKYAPYEEPVTVLVSPGPIFRLLPDEWGVHRRSLTTTFHPAGSTELYPIDEYMLNIACRFSKI